MHAHSNGSVDSDSEGIARSDEESGDPTTVKSGTVLRCSVCATHHPERLEFLELHAYLIQLIREECITSTIDNDLFTPLFSYCLLTW